MPTAASQAACTSQLKPVGISEKRSCTCIPTIPHMHSATTVLKDAQQSCALRVVDDLMGPLASVICQSSQYCLLSSSCMPDQGFACRSAKLLTCSHAEAPIPAAEVQQPVVRPDARQLQRLSGASLQLSSPGSETSVSCCAVVPAGCAGQALALEA